MVDLLEIKKDLRKLSTADGNPIVDFNVGFRAGIVELGNYTSRESAVAEVKSALFHARKQDLPGSPSKYVVLGTQPHLLSEQKRKLMVDFDRLVEGGCTKG